ncbi:MAG: tRNA lysidine(34) synthetase TilS [bacterium]
MLVALSGGPDSVALLMILYKLKDELKISPEALHVNHMIRFDDSDKDEKFCRDLCEKLNIPITIICEDIPARAENEKKGLEESARNFRYKVLNDVAEEKGFNKIAVGHHADDQVETILFRIFRGTGRTGFFGIPIKRDKIIRPLLHVAKKDIIKFLNEEKIEFCHDFSNEDNNFTRNYIRNSLLKDIRENINSSVDSNLLNLADTIMEEDRFLDSIVNEKVKESVSISPGGKIELALELFCGYDIWLRRRLLRYCLSVISIDGLGPDKAVVDRLDLACRTSRKGISLSGNIQASCNGSKMIIYRPGNFIESRAFMLGQQLEVLELNISVNGQELIFKPELLIKRRFSPVVVIDADKVFPPFEIRGIKNGDRFQPLGMEGTKTAGSFLADRKIDPLYRNEVPVLVDKRGLIWLIGYEIADRVKVDSTTRKVLKLESKERKAD